MRLGAIVTVAAWLADAIRTCMHSPTPQHPQPVFAVAWRPGVIACALCPHLLHVGMGTRAGRTCDLCRCVGRRSTRRPDLSDDTGVPAAALPLGAAVLCTVCCPLPPSIQSPGG